MNRRLTRLLPAFAGRGDLSAAQGFSFLTRRL
jgi:hypothetical protein